MESKRKAPRGTGERVPPRDGSAGSRRTRQADAILAAVAHAAQAFLTRPRWEESVPEVLRRLGLAVGVSRVYVFENHLAPDGRLLVSQRNEWTAPGIRPELDNPLLQNSPVFETDFRRWAVLLSSGRAVKGKVRELPLQERGLLESQDVLSIAAVPVRVEGSWWGFMGFDDCVKERGWSPAVLSALRTAADLFGAMVTRRDLEERWRRLASATSEGILFHDAGQILDANARLAELTGYTMEEVAGLGPLEFVAAEDRDLAREHALAARQEPYEVRIVRRDGSVFPAEIQGRQIRFRGREVRVVTVRDLSMRKEAEERARRLDLERAARRQAEVAEDRAAFLAEVSRVLASSLDTTTTLAQAAQLAVPMLADGCAIDVLDSGTLRRVVQVSSRTPHGAPTETLLSPHESGGPPDAAATRALAGETVLLERPAPEETPGSGRSGFTLLVPIRSRDRVLGIITAVRLDAGGVPPGEDRKLAEELAHRVATALEHARLFEEARAAVYARDEILSVVTHDLRTPLSVIVTGLEALLELDGSPAQRHLGDLVFRNADRMNRMVDDLLEVARITHGRLSLAPRVLAPHSLLAEATATMQPLAESREISLELDAPAAMPPIRADADRVIQVLSNLIGNAIKFSPPGTHVRVGCEPGDGEARFRVTDTGPGISPDQIPDLFGPFWQADSSDRRGLGLGLSIARGIVEAHGGRIWVESRVGLGTTFFFTLPHAGDEVQASAAGTRVEVRPAAPPAPAT